MYRIPKTDLVLLHSRGKVHEIIHHAIVEDADMEWSVIKKKLTSNYGSTRSRIKASVKISKLSMNSKETVGEYLARAKTLVKSKIKDSTSWNSDIDEADMYHVCNRLLKAGLKSRMLQRDVGRGKRGVPQIWQVSHTAWILDTQTQTNNSFAEKQNNATPQSDATALVEKLQQLILTQKNPAYQVNEVQVVTPDQHYMGPQSCHGITFHTGGSVRVTNC